MKRFAATNTAWLVLLALGGALLSAPAPAAAAGGHVLALDLRAAVELAYEANVELLLAELELEKARLGLQQVRALSLIEPSPTLLLQAETGVTLAERNLSLTRQRVAFQVEEAYYNVLRLHNVIAVLDDAEQMAQRQLEVAESRRAAGVATDVDVLRARADKAQAEDNLALVLVQFRQMLGLAPDAEIALDDTVVTHDLVDMTLAEALEEALANRIELAQVRLGVEVARRELELADNDYTPELTRRSAELDLAQMELQMRQAKDGITLDVHNAYNAMRDAHRRLAVAQQRLLEVEENWRVVQALFDARMATDVEI